MGRQANPPVPRQDRQYEREVEELQNKISVLKASCAAKEREVAALKQQIENRRKTDLTGDSEFDEQLKKAKKAAFVARGNVIKKNLEIGHLKNELQSNQEHVATFDKALSFLQSDIGNLRDGMEGLKNTLLSKVEEVTCQLTVSNAELASLREREKMWIESNTSLKTEIVGMREQFESFKKEMFEEIRKMNRQQLVNNTPQPPSFQGKEFGTQWTHSTVREEAKELDERLQRAREKIVKVEEKISHQGDQLQSLVNAANAELATPKVHPGTPEQATCHYLPTGDQQPGYSTPKIPCGNGQAGLHKVNPYSLRASKAKSGVLNSRPLPSSTIGTVQAPVGVGPLMAALPQVPPQAPPQAPPRDMGRRPPMIYNPYAQNAQPVSSSNGHLNGRPLPRSTDVHASFPQHPAMYPAKAEEEGFFTRTFNKFFGF